MRPATRALTAVALLVLVSSALASEATSRPAVAAARCNASTVHYQPAAQAPRGVAGPWIASTGSAFRGYLFYLGSTPWFRERPRGAHIFTSKAAVSVNPKVLWIARPGSGASVTITGTRLDAPGSFGARYPGVGGAQYPSFVRVPAAGCWRVTLRSGSLRGSVTFVASDTP